LTVFTKATPWHLLPHKLSMGISSYALDSNPTYCQLRLFQFLPLNWCVVALCIQSV